MVTKRFSIVWTKQAEQHLHEILEHISTDSPQNALKVINDIIESIEKAIENPDVYPADKYRSENDGTFRAFEKHKYRLSYRYSSDTIRVLRIRHTKMTPKYY